MGVHRWLYNDGAGLSAHLFRRALLQGQHRRRESSVRARTCRRAALAEKKAELDKFEKMYQNPAINAGLTFLEPLPVALIISLVSALVLSRRKADDPEPGAA